MGGSCCRRPLFDKRYSDEEVRDSLSQPELLPWALKECFFEESIADDAAREVAERVLRWVDLLTAPIGAVTHLKRIEHSQTEGQAA